VTAAGDPIATPPPLDELAGRLTRTEVQRSRSSIPGRDFVQVLTDIPCGVESGWHTHPGEEVGYILTGTVTTRIHDQPTLPLHARDGHRTDTVHLPRRPGPPPGHLHHTATDERCRARECGQRQCRCALTRSDERETR
jgi:hypothetical protein